MDKALLIGITYKANKDWPELPSSSKDAVKLKALLTGVHWDTILWIVPLIHHRCVAEKYDFKEENVVILSDDGQHELPTKTNIVRDYLVHGLVYT